MISKKPRVLVVGDIIIDEYWYTDVSRVCPEAPVPVAVHQKIVTVIGGAGNVAANVSKLGAQAHLLSIASSEDAERVKGLMIDYQVDLSFKIDESYHVPIKTRIISDNQIMLRVDNEERGRLLDVKTLSETFSEIVAGFDLVVFSDYGFGTLAEVGALIKAARKTGVTTIVDPKGSDFSKYKSACYITPNLGELEAVVGTCRDLQTIRRKGMQLRQDLAVDGVLVTLGSDGLYAITEDAEVKVDGREVDVHDVTGAGDTVVAGLAVQLANGVTIKNALDFANRAASIAVRKFGTMPVTLDEVNEEILSDHKYFCSTYLTINDFRRDFMSIQESSAKIVMTNGCFDVLHPGHIAYLADAKSFGDILIVFVNSDASIRRLKGDSRPIHSEKDRVRALSALRFIDHVVLFEEDTPESIYREFTPDILVKGSDYSMEEIVGADHVIKNGGTVKRIELLEDYSTTNIIKRLLE